jgi:hypothetical protein
MYKWPGSAGLVSGGAQMLGNISSQFSGKFGLGCLHAVLHVSQELLLGVFDNFVDV